MVLWTTLLSRVSSVFTPGIVSSTTKSIGDSEDRPTWRQRAAGQTGSDGVTASQIRSDGSDPVRRIRRGHSESDGVRRGHSESDGVRRDQTGSDGSDGSNGVTAIRRGHGPHGVGTTEPRGIEWGRTLHGFTGSQVTGGQTAYIVRGGGERGDKKTYGLARLGGRKYHFTEM